VRNSLEKSELLKSFATKCIVAFLVGGKMTSGEEYDLLDQDDYNNVSFLMSIQRRIAIVEDYHLLGSSDLRNLKHIYSNPTSEDFKDIILCRSLDHTMFESIDEYCRQKFPEEKIKKCILSDYKFEVYGVFPQHFTEMAGYLGFSTAKRVSFVNNSTSKRTNFMRPEFFDCTKKNNERIFAVAVGCGHDYVMHYASMLQHVLDMFTVSSKIKIVRYPLAETSLPIWTELGRNFVERDECVILGYIDEIDRSMGDNRAFEKINETENEYYISLKYRNVKTGLKINLLGIKFSFWGDISAKIVTQLCQLGVKEIIYVGKLGGMVTPNDIYNKIFSPSRFLIFYHDKIVSKVTDLRNDFLVRFPELDSGFHASVPTVIEEDYIQRKITDHLKISSIDNEISQMAFAIKKFNNMHGDDVAFATLHFATDYVRRTDERDISTRFDMSNNRTSDAIQGKKKLLDKITKVLMEYLEEK
jgi:hypothetical protein